MRPQLEQLESRDAPSHLGMATKTTLGPRGRDSLQAEIRLAEQTVRKEVAIIMKDGLAGQHQALNVLQSAAEQLAAVLNPPPATKG